MPEPVPVSRAAPIGVRTPVLGVLVAAVLALAALTVTVAHTGSLGSLDRWCTSAFRHAPASGPLYGLVVAVTWSGSIGVGAAALIVLGSELSWRRRSPVPLLTTTAVTLALAASVYLLKELVARTRPKVPVGTDPEPGYPSGHAATAAVLTGTALVLLWSTVLHDHRRLAVAVAVGYVLAVGVSRLYLEVHWLSDVLAGWLLGVALVSALALCGAKWPSRNQGAGPPGGRGRAAATSR